MNWLAHLFLATPNVENRLGNLLADLVKGTARDNLSSGIKQGIKCHQAIDLFTDSHPVVLHSKKRIDRQYRRFSGILIDVFYDHILAKNWHYYSEILLEEFTETIYRSFDLYLGSIPDYANNVINRMIAEDWLLSYRDRAGIELVLKRISWKLTRRRRKHYDLSPAIKELITNYQELEQDFKIFFPALQNHVNTWHSLPQNSEVSRQILTKPKN